MGRRISLRLRLNLAFAALLGLGLFADVIVTIRGAGKRVEPEITSSTVLTGDIIRGALRGLHDGPELESTLDALAISLDKLRHVHVTFTSAVPTGLMKEVAAEDDKRRPPDWFVALIHPRPMSQRIEAVVNGRDIGAFVVAGDPNDEISELWDGVVDLALDGGVAAAIGFVLLYFVVRGGLKPLENLDAGLKALSAGNYRVKLEPGEPPEFAELLSRFNALGDSLLAAEDENQRLRARLVSIQDDERKEIARELHDEIGPHLFAARAQAQLAQQSLPKGAKKASIAVETVMTSIDALQEANRRILGWLRPAALDQYGLAELFDALRRFWAQARPDMKVVLDLPSEMPSLAPAFQAALYRIAQEALTNAARHGNGDAVRVASNIHENRDLTLSVRDNGEGFDPSKRAFGLGLLGIGERVAAYAGKLDLLPVDPHGLEVRATFPRALA